MIKIVSQIPTQDELEENDHSSFLKIIKQTHISAELHEQDIIFQAYEGEPEDNSLGRNFSDCYSIIKLMRDAYLAGQRGELWEFEGYEIS